MPTVFTFNESITVNPRNRIYEYDIYIYIKMERENNNNINNNIDRKKRYVFRKFI